MKRSLTVALISLVLCAPLFAAEGPSSRVIEPTQRVGAITPLSTLKEVIKIYGAARVAPAKDGRSCQVFPGTRDEVYVEFHDSGHGVARLSIEASSSTWATASGIKIGTTLVELETINGGPFDITGTNWDAPARIVSWKGGTLPPQMYIDLAPAEGEMGPEIRKRLTSRKNFIDSSNEALAGFVVSRILLEW